MHFSGKMKPRLPTVEANPENQQLWFEMEVGTMSPLRYNFIRKQCYIFIMKSSSK